MIRANIIYTRSVEMKMVKKYTVMLIPFNQEKVLRFKISNVSLLLIGGFLFILFVFTALSLFSEKSLFNIRVSESNNYHIRDTLEHFNRKLNRSNVKYRTAKEEIERFLEAYYPVFNERYLLSDSMASGERLKFLIRILNQFQVFREQLNVFFTDIPSIFPVVGGGEVNSPFGTRLDPFTGTLAFHTGVDIFKLPGVPVRSTGTGKIVFSGWSPSYGFMTIIEHGFGFQTLYAHMRSMPVVKAGEDVKQGEIIGYVGSTGRSVGYHLHYEVHNSHKLLDPVDFLFLKNH
jgi:murein DD-endopeptidase MepM/ murein hydrolase activator NlpD